MAHSADSRALPQQKDFNKLPKQILLAVSSKGIQIMKVGRKSPYLQFKLSEIYRWGFKPDTNFYFEVKKGAYGVHRRAQSAPVA